MHAVFQQIDVVTASAPDGAIILRMYGATEVRFALSVLETLD